SKVKGLATCNLQTTSPSGFLNNFNLKILSNFLGSVHNKDFGFFCFLMKMPPKIFLFCCKNHKDRKYNLDKTFPNFTECSKIIMIKQIDL
ncbi:hypothetical protein, partial [Anaerotignum lactatifermentans]|uniref:hypothetical protein n=1 Tax=Anaerotignum lactatifermentans TaxID=160404 RepID=UPI001A9BC908